MTSILETPALRISRNAVSHSVVRLQGASPSICQALGGAISREWPIHFNTATAGDPAILWTAPGEWAVMGAFPRALRETLERSGGDLLWQISDLSAATTAFRVEGSEARSLMSACCSLDLHPRSFHEGRCAQTLFAQIQALIHQVDDSPSYVVYVDSSLAHHAQAWMLDAASSPAIAHFAAGASEDPAPR